MLLFYLGFPGTPDKPGTTGISEKPSTPSYPGTSNSLDKPVVPSKPVGPGMFIVVILNCGFTCI